MALVSQEQVARAADVNVTTVRSYVLTIRDVLELEEWGLPQRRGTFQRRYPAELREGVLGIYRELISLGFRKRTAMNILVDLCEGQVRHPIVVLREWVHRYEFPPTSEASISGITCTAVCEDHGEHCRNRFKHTRIHFHLTQGAKRGTVRTPRCGRKAHYWDTG